MEKLSENKFLCQFCFTENFENLIIFFGINHKSFQDPFLSTTFTSIYSYLQQCVSIYIYIYNYVLLFTNMYNYTSIYIMISYGFSYI